MRQIPCAHTLGGRAMHPQKLSAVASFAFSLSASSSAGSIFPALSERGKLTLCGPYPWH